MGCWVACVQYRLCTQCWVVCGMDPETGCWVFYSIPPVSEDEAREALCSYASSNCCYSKAPAVEGVITSIESFNTYRVRAMPLPSPFLGLPLTLTGACQRYALLQAHRAVNAGSVPWLLTECVCWAFFPPSSLQTQSSQNITYTSTLAGPQVAVDRLIDVCKALTNHSWWSRECLICPLFVVLLWNREVFVSTVQPTKDMVFVFIPDPAMMRKVYVFFLHLWK